MKQELLNAEIAERERGGRGELRFVSVLSYRLPGETLASVSAVIRMAFQDSEGAVDLFQQDYSCQFVG